MSAISCTIKRLPPDAWQQAARDAVVVNPANAPAVEALMQVAPDVVIDPQHLAILTAKYWGANGVKLSVGFLDNPPTELRKRILFHMNAWGAWANVTIKTDKVDAGYPKLIAGNWPGLFTSYLGA